MLNLFKFLSPIGKNQDDEQNPPTDFAIGVLKNYIRHRNDLSDEDLGRACDKASDELASLHERLRRPGADAYDEMMNALRGMEDGFEEKSVSE